MEHKIKTFDDSPKRIKWIWLQKQNLDPFYEISMHLLQICVTSAS